MWPEGMHAAAALTFDFDTEEVSIGKDRQSKRRGRSWKPVTNSRTTCSWRTPRWSR